MNGMFLVLTLAVQQPQDTVVLKPVVVTATRVPVAADLVASAVTVLRGADLVARGFGPSPMPWRPFPASTSWRRAASAGRRRSSCAAARATT